MVSSNLLLCGNQNRVCSLLIERRSNDDCTGVPTFDFGQNMAGWCRFKLHCPSGFGTYILHGEILVQPVISNTYSTRNIYTENLIRAIATDRYVFHGDPGLEIYEPTYELFSIINLYLIFYFLQFYHTWFSLSVYI